VPKGVKPKESEIAKGKGLPVRETHARLLAQVQVNVPYRLLVDRYLELFIHYGINPEIGFDAASLESCTHQGPTERNVARLMAEQGRTVTFHGPFIDLAPGGVDAGVRELTLRRFQRVMDLVPIFRPQSVVFHAGYDDWRYSALRQKWLESSLETWRPLCKRARELGVMIHLENVYERTPEMILALIEAISSESVGFCLDVGHMMAFSDTSLETWLEALGPYLREIHLHDNDGKRDAHGPIGSGSVPFKELFGYLSSKEGTRPLITLEPHEEETLWKSLENLVQLWPWQE
jgi:sugar phosphate isomerase/epimerase